VLEARTKARGMKAFATCEEAARWADVVVVAVKPHLVEGVVKPIRGILKDRLVLSVAVGRLFDFYESILEPGTRHLSTLPNTPVSINEGIVICEARHSMTLDDEAFVEQLFAKLGLAEFADEKMMSAAGTLAGCGPAFAAMFIARRRRRQARRTARGRLFARLPDACGHRKAPARDGRASRCDEGRRLLARRHDDHRRCGARKKGLPLGRDRRNRCDRDEEPLRLYLSPLDWSGKFRPPDGDVGGRNVFHRNSRRKPPNSFGWRNAANLSLPIYLLSPMKGVCLSNPCAMVLP